MLLATSLGVPGATETVTYCGLGWLGGTALLMASLRPPLRNNFWVWTMLFVFLMGYYVKYFSFAYGMGGPIFDILMFEWAWAGRPDLNHALVVSTFGYVTFAVATSALLWRDRPSPEPAAVSRFALDERWVVWILGATLFGVVASLAAAIVFGYGQMGVEHKALPFHFDAVLTRFRISLAPMILLWLLWLTDRRQTKRLWIASILVLVLSAALDAFVRGSRGSIALAFVPVIFLWLISGTYTKARQTLSVSVVLLTLALYPLFTALRLQRIATDKGAEFNAQVATEQATSSDGIALSLNQVAGRVVGIDSMMQVQRYVDAGSAPQTSLTTISLGRVAWLANGGAMVMFMTHQVVGIADDIVEGRSPGVLGGLYLVGGLDGMVLFTLLYVAGIWAAWRYVARLEYAPPLLAYLASAILSYTQEGVFGLENPISTALAMGLTVWVFRRWIIKKAPHPDDATLAVL